MVLHELRWMGYYDLLSRYIKLRPFLHLFEADVQPDRVNGDDSDSDSGASGDDSDDDSAGDGGVANDGVSDSDGAGDCDTVASLIPSSSEHATLKQHFEDMGSIAYVTKTLQSPQRSLTEVRELFDILIADFPVMTDRLSSTASIVQSPSFESVLCKLQSKTESSMTLPEIEAVKRFLVAPTSVTVTPSTASMKGKGKKKRTADDIHDLLKSKRLKIAESGSRYVKIEWVPPTSVAVERVFSQVKAVTGYLRRSMSTQTLDNLLLLKLSWDLVDVSVVSDAIKSLQRHSDIDSDAESDASDADFSHGFSDTE